MSINSKYSCILYYRSLPGFLPNWPESLRPKIYLAVKRSGWDNLYVSGLTGDGEGCVVGEVWERMTRTSSLPQFDVSIRPLNCWKYTSTFCLNLCEDFKSCFINFHSLALLLTEVCQRWTSLPISWPANCKQGSHRDTVWM